MASSGQVADWEHRYSAHIKNANVYAEASRWADGQYIDTTHVILAILIMMEWMNLLCITIKFLWCSKVLAEKQTGYFTKMVSDAYSVVGSDMAYWSETEGDYNESSNNHFAALSDVYPNQQHSIYNITIDQCAGDTVIAILNSGVSENITYTGNDYLDVVV